MLDNVINLLEDTNDVSWASHAVLLCSMEQGEITGWSDVEKIDRIRHAQMSKVRTRIREILPRWSPVLITTKMHVFDREKSRD